MPRDGVCFGALTLFMLVFGAPSADAFAAEIAVVDLHLDDAPPAVKKEAERWLESSLRGVGYDVLSSKETAKRLASAELATGCAFGPCMARVGKALKVGRALVGGIAVLGTSYDILLSLIDTESGSPIAQVRVRCDVCNFDDVGASVARAAKDLHESAQRFEAARARLVVKGNEGATVMLDDVAIGQAPLVRFATPGADRLELRAKGRVVRCDVHLVAGARFEVKGFFSGAAPEMASPVVSSRRSRGEPGWLGWAALAAGGGAIAAGMVTLALDEGCPAGSCAGRRETRVGGLTLMGVGAALTITAGVLFWHATRRQAKTASRGAAMFLSAGKGSLGLSCAGTF